MSQKYNTTNTDDNANVLHFTQKNYKWILIGVVTMIVGFLLMVGGNMPSPDVWDESLIYSFRRITLAPIVIIIGIGINVYAIFVK